MANNKSAEKKNRQSLARNERNRNHRSKMRTAVKKLRAAVEAGDAESAKSLLPATIGLVSHSAQKGVIHPNAASRTASRLQKAVNGLAK